MTPLTVASWNERFDEGGLEALVQMRDPVNRLPELVGYLVRRLKPLGPTTGSRRLAHFDLQLRRVKAVDSYRFRIR